MKKISVVSPQKYCMQKTMEVHPTNVTAAVGSAGSTLPRCTMLLKPREGETHEESKGPALITYCYPRVLSFLLLSNNLFKRKAISKRRWFSHP